MHPDFPNILARLAPEDEAALISIAEPTEAQRLTKNLKHSVRTILNGLRIAAPVGLVSVGHMIDAAAGGKKPDFHQTHLANLNLIVYDTAGWRLTAIGKAFLTAIADPCY